MSVSNADLALILRIGCHIVPLAAAFPKFASFVGAEIVPVVMTGAQVVEARSEQEETDYEATRKQLAQKEYTERLSEAHRGKAAYCRNESVPECHDGVGSQRRHAGAPYKEHDEGLDYTFHSVFYLSFL